MEQNPDIPFGVHLTAVSENEQYRWGPLVCAEKAPSLVDEDGCFYHEHRIPEFLAQVNLAELEAEFRAQIETVLATGLKPTHVDSHCGIHTRREDIFDLTVGLAREYGLAIRTGEPPLIEKLQRQGYASGDYNATDSYRLETRDKPAVYHKMLRELPAGLSEWAVHPALLTAELKAMSPSWDVRVADYEFLMSPETRQIIKEEGIILLDFRPLQAAWQAKGT
jgi:predicted glycoside hydrolase/deacetylase ChbG (UPF0249 family)